MLDNCMQLALIDYLNPSKGKLTGHKSSFLQMNLITWLDEKNMYLSVKSVGQPCYAHLNRRKTEMIGIKS